MGYLFVAPGALSVRGTASGTIQIGGGGELAIVKGVSAGVELSALGPTDGFADDVQGVASFNGYYHFVHDKTARFDPFVTAGYSLFFRRGTENLFNFGGGMNYWLTQHLGLRLEVRDQVYSPDLVTLHFWGVRVGVTF
jgi:hypothetical protein